MFRFISPLTTCWCIMSRWSVWLRLCGNFVSVCSCGRVALCLVLLLQSNSTWVWMRLRPLNQRICPRRSSLSAQSISSSSSASSSPSSSPGSRPSPASFRQGRRSVGTVAITWKPDFLHSNLTRKRLCVFLLSGHEFFLPSFTLEGSHSSWLFLP